MNFEILFNLGESMILCTKSGLAYVLHLCISERYHDWIFRLYPHLSLIVIILSIVLLHTFLLHIYIYSPLLYHSNRGVEIFI